VTASTPGWLPDRARDGHVVCGSRTTVGTSAPWSSAWPGDLPMMCAGININRRRHVRVLPFVTGNTGERSLTEDGMEDAVTERIEQQVRSAFPNGAIARVQVLQYGDDPEVEPGQTAMRVFFDWPGRSDGKKADPKTVHAFVVASSAALDVLRDELPSVIRWVEFRPEPPAGAASPHGLAYRITDRGRRAAALDGFVPVMTRLGPADLATLDGLVTAGIVNSRAEGVRWAIGRLREHRA
jgi:hypothetical protein